MKLKPVITILLTTITTFTYASNQFSNDGYTQLLGRSTMNPGYTSIAPFVGSTSDDTTSYFEVHSVFPKVCITSGDCHHTSYIMGDIVNIKKGEFNNKTDYDISRVLNINFTPGSQPSLQWLSSDKSGNNYYVMVTSTQNAPALEAFLLKVYYDSSDKEYKIDRLDSVNIGRGENPSLANLGDNNFIVTSNNTHNSANTPYLGAYWFSIKTGTNGEPIGINTPSTMSSYDNGNYAAIAAVGDNKVLETNNGLNNTLEYTILASKNGTFSDNTQLIKSNLNPNQCKNSQGQYTYVQLIPMNQENSQNGEEFLQLYTLKSYPGKLYNRIITYKDGSIECTNSSISAHTEYNFGTYPSAFSYDKNKFIEINTGTYMTSSPALYGGIWQYTSV
ncbi:hypothetical protein OAO18_09045 [Francisellaceae bacterium]|nr:hypothetical protein [Francisellaceae bacterium]